MGVRKERKRVRMIQQQNIAKRLIQVIVRIQFLKQLIMIVKIVVFFVDYILVIGNDTESDMDVFYVNEQPVFYTL